MAAASSSNYDPIYAQVFPLSARKGDLKKIAIIEAAIESVHKYGSDGFSYNRIGKVAGISRAHVAHYFPKKTEILQLALQLIALKAQELTISKIAKSANSMEALRAVAEAAVENLETHPRYAAILMLCFQESAVNAKFREFHSLVRSMGSERIAEILRTIPKWNSVSLARRISLAQQIQAIIIGHLVLHHSTNSGVKEKALVRQIWSVVEAMLTHAES